jgi:hypothetical protein
MNPPVRPGEWDYQGRMHCDTNPNERPGMLQTRSVIYLSDTPEERGAFECVPGFHRHLDDWLKYDSPNAPWPGPDVSGLKTQKLAGGAGDCIIFNAVLPHRNTRNTTLEPRLAVLNHFFPSPQAPSELQRHRWPHEVREDRIAAFYEHRPLQPSMVDRAVAIGGAATEMARYGGTPVVLSELGEKLVGLRAWATST